MYLNINYFLIILYNFLITLIITPKFIEYFYKKKIGQKINKIGPEWHNFKTGIPTMGGLIILINLFFFLILSYFLKLNFDFNFFIKIIFISFFYGFIGLLDDLIKILNKRNMGLNFFQKIIFQIIIAIFSYFIFNFNYFFKIKLNFYNFFLNILYFIIFVIWIVGFSNAVNLTDGIDGLISGLNIIIFLTYAIIANLNKQIFICNICLCIVGSLLGFIIFNIYPAKIFIGDVGSLFLGSLLSIIPIILKCEWTLIFIGIIYILETFSVIIQVIYFKIFKKRFFKMAPFHHHLEICNFSEKRINIFFWLITLIFSFFIIIFIIFKKYL